MEKTIFIFGLIAAYSLLTVARHGPKFSEKNFVVHFEPSSISRNDHYPDVYDEFELTSIIAKISTRFKRIVIPSFDGRYHSIVQVPTAAAKYNKQRNQSETPIELVMIYEPVQFWSLNFSFHKEVADKGNDIFPGTVKLFLGDFREKEYEPKNLTSMLAELDEINSILKAANPFHYKLGVLTDSRFCNSSEVPWETLNTIASKVDLIMFDYPTHNDDIMAGYTSAEKLPRKFHNCKTYVNRNCKDIEVGFRTTWSETTITGVRNTANLVRFWQLMNEWVDQTSTTIVLDQTFDTPEFANKLLQNTGWWRLIESSLYNNAADYQFNEKIDGPVYNQESNSSMWLPKYFPEDKEMNFNVTNFAVAFSPYVSKDDTRIDVYNKDDLVPLLQLVSREFHRILFHVTPVGDIGMGYQSDILGAVAQLKSEGKLPKTFEVIVALMCQDVCDRQIYMNSDFENLINSLNDIQTDSPGTVKTLLIYYQKLTDDNTNKIMADFQTVRNMSKKLYPSPTNFRFGILLEKDEYETARSNHNPAWRQLFKQIDTVYFRIAPTMDDLHLDVEKSLGGYFRKFRFNKEKALADNKNLEVGLMMEWPDTTEDGDQNVGKLVEFWGKVKNWAVKTNTTVIINEAFDAPFRIQPTLTTRGWWRLANDSPEFSTNKSTYKFVDKKTVFLTETNKDNGNGGGTLLNVKLVIVAAVVVIISFSGIAITVVYIKLRKIHPRALSREEIKEFLHGEGASLLPFVDTPDHLNILECRKTDFSIDDRNVLGSGEFGTVFMGKLHRNGVKINVAAKTMRPSCTIVTFRGILSEIKILQYIGKHNNIVCIVGAYTAELHKGKVYVFTEYCKLGSLEKFLKSVNSVVTKGAIPRKVRTITSDSGGYSYVKLEESYEEEGNIETLSQDQFSELVKWAREICSGMEFLALKHVVHADLATRNVLLTEDKVAKITDFGLSLKIYANEERDSPVESQNDAVWPWRWMSPESLKRKVFNEKTDVWAFGVTLWEIFSCGEIPYCGLMWSANFLDQLEAGFRLGSPRYSHDNLYELMQNCWEFNGSNRPTFSELKSQLDLN